MCEYFKNTTEIIIGYIDEESYNFYDFFQRIRFPNINLNDLNKLTQFFTTIFPLEEIPPRFDEDVCRGLGFGAQEPRIVEKMWKQTFEIEESEHWEQFREMGLDLPETQGHIPITKMEELVLLQTSAFVQNYKPRLINIL